MEYWGGGSKEGEGESQVKKKENIQSEMDSGTFGKCRIVGQIVGWWTTFACNSIEYGTERYGIQVQVAFWMNQLRSIFCWLTT